MDKNNEKSVLFRLFRNGILTFQVLNITRPISSVHVFCVPHIKTYMFDKKKLQSPMVGYA